MIKFMKKDHYKENKIYGSQLDKNHKISARERSVLSRLNLIKKAGVVSSGALLEIGSHEGLFLREAQKAGFEILGIEPNLYVADYAIKNGLPTITGSFEESFEKVKDKKFDVVALFHTLEHMSDYLENLKKIETIINLGGYLIIEVPNSESYRSKKYGDDWVYVYEEHLHHFSPRGIKEILLSIGFTVKKIYFRDFDEMRMSIKQSLDRLLPIKIRGANVKYKNMDDGETPSSFKKTELKSKKIISLLIPLIRTFLAFCVKVLKRGDFMFIVAKIK